MHARSLNTGNGQAMKLQSLHFLPLMRLRLPRLVFIALLAVLSGTTVAMSRSGHVDSFTALDQMQYQCSIEILERKLAVARAESGNKSKADREKDVEAARNAPTPACVKKK